MGNGGAGVVGKGVGCLITSLFPVASSPKTVFVSLDQGNGRDPGPDVNRYSALDGLVDSLPSSTSVIMSAYGTESRYVKENMLQSMLGKSK